MKRWIFALLYHAGAARLAGWWNRHRVIVLCYHGVTRRTSRSPYDPDGLHVRVDRFRAHLEHLRRHYRPVGLGDYLAARAGGRRLPSSAVVVTFDDGFRNFLTVAAPMLAERGIPATLFVVTDWATAEDGTRPRDWSPADDEGYLSWAEVEALRARWRVEVGSHTCSHSRLPALERGVLERELRASFGAIAERLRARPLALAYPYGAWSPSVAEEARSSGYGGALTTEPGTNDSRTDLFALRRVLVGDEDLPEFAVRVSGLAGWLAAVRRRVGETA